MEQMDHFFDANEIVGVGKKMSVFLAVVGPTTYALLRNLVSLARPGDKTFAELVAALKEPLRSGSGPGNGSGTSGVIVPAPGLLDRSDRSRQRERHFWCNSPGTRIIRSFSPM